MGDKIGTVLLSRPLKTIQHTTVSIVVVASQMFPETVVLQNAIQLTLMAINISMAVNPVESANNISQVLVSIRYFEHLNRCTRCKRDNSVVECNWTISSFIFHLNEHEKCNNCYGDLHFFYRINSTAWFQRTSFPNYCTIVSWARGFYSDFYA